MSASEMEGLLTQLRAQLAAAETKAEAERTARIRLEEELATVKVKLVTAETKAEAEGMARVRLEEELATAETNAEVENARTRLFSQAQQFATLSDWIQVFKASNIPSIPNEEQYLCSYKSSSSLDNSINYQDSASSSITTTPAINNISMHSFRRNQIAGMQVRALNLDDTMITQLVCKQANDNIQADTDKLVAELSNIVKMIREALFYQEMVSHIKCQELKVVQPLFMLLAEHAMSLVLPRGKVTIAQGIRLQGTVRVEPAPATKTLTGFADLLFYNSNIFQDSLEDLQCVCELKKPFGKLQHSGAHAAKDQLLAELEACGQMTGEAHHIFGLLSDFFVVCVVIRSPPTEDSDHPIFYQSPRVATASSFVLRLLFVLLDLSVDDFTTLLHDCTTEIEVPADDECGSTEETSAAAAGLSEGPLPVGPAAPRVIKEQGKAVEVRKVFLCPEYLAAVRKEEEQMAKESDCARRGLAYLSEDELNKRNWNFVKRDIAALL